MTRYKPLKKPRKSDEVNLILAALEELVNRELSRSDELYGEDKQEELGEYLTAIRLCRSMRETKQEVTPVREELLPWHIDDDANS